MSIKFKDVSPKITAVRCHGDDKGYVKIYVVINGRASLLCEYFNEVLTFHKKPRQLHGLTHQEALNLVNSTWSHAH